VDGLFALILAVAGILAFDFAAGSSGADSREQMPDDHQR
jgi:hypothetical protein